MKKNIIMMTTIVFLICGVLLYIGYGIKKQEKNYKILESDLIEAAEIYYKKNDLNIVIGSTQKVTSKELLDEHLIETMEVDDDLCDGYVNIKRNRNDFNYKVYIKCKNYETAEE